MPLLAPPTMVLHLRCSCLSSPLASDCSPWHFRISFVPITRGNLRSMQSNSDRRAPRSANSPMTWIKTTVHGTQVPFSYTNPEECCMPFFCTCIYTTSVSRTFWPNEAPSQNHISRVAAQFEIALVHLLTVYNPCPIHAVAICFDATTSLALQSWS